MSGDFLRLFAKLGCTCRGVLLLATAHDRSLPLEEQPTYSSDFLKSLQGNPHRGAPLVPELRQIAVGLRGDESSEGEAHRRDIDVGLGFVRHLDECPRVRTAL